MTPFAATAIFAAGAFAGALWGYLDVPGWLFHGWARMRGGTWFTQRQECRGCHRRVHVLRHDPMAAASGDGHLCPRCAGVPKLSERN